jgi:3-oxoacyl-[acyl-carrier-protein] synthase III
MNDISLSSISYALGEHEHEVTGDGPARLNESQRAKLLENGLKYYRTSSRSPSELAAESVAGTLDDAGIDPKEIEAVVYTTCSFWSDPELPGLGKGAQLSSEFSRKIVRNVVHALGMSNAQSYGVFLAESGNFTSGIRVARNLIVADGLRNVIYVNTDKLTDEESKVVPSEISMMSEAACSCLVSSEERGGFRLGKLAQKSNPLMSTFAADAALKVLMEVAKGVKATCNAVTGGDASVYRKLVTNNYSRNTLMMLAHQAGCTEAQLYMDNLPRFAHAFACDNLINLKDLCASEGVSPGDRFLMLSSGPLTWGALELEKI